MKTINIISLVLGAGLSTSTADDRQSPRPDSHAPISIMGDHVHKSGEWMLSYRYMHMDMGDLFAGIDRITAGQAFSANYTVSPTRMTMDMRMIGAMYAPSDDITLMAMLPYLDMEMDHLIFPGAAPLIALNGGRPGFSTRSSGVGDLKLSSLIRLLDRDTERLHAGVGVSLPTGSIGEKDLIPGPGGLIPRQLPAAMQLGSGTVDILPSLTWTHLADRWSAGAQVLGVIRTGTNAHDYRLGNRFGIDSWAAWMATEWMSLSGGIGYRWEDELSGTQSDLSFHPPFAPSRRTVPTAFGENYGGQRIEAILGANFVVPCGPLQGHRLAVDLRLPLWQDRNGISLGTDSTLTAGWQYAF